MFYTSCGIDKQTAKGWRGYLLYKDEESGKAKKKYKTFNTRYKREAKKLVNEWRDSEEEKAERKIPFVTVEEAIKDFLGKQYARHYITTRVYQTDSRQAELNIYPYIGKEDFYHITTETLQHWVDTLNKKYAPKSTRLYFSIFGKTYNNAIRLGLIEHNAKAGVIIPRDKGKKRIAYLDKEGRKKLLSLIEDGTVIGARTNNLYIPICLAFYGGLRAEEVCGLQWRDINFAARTILVERATKNVKDENGKTIVVTEDTKNYKSRTVPICEQLLEALKLEESRTDHDIKDYVCHWQNPQTLCTGFRTWAQRNNVFSVLGTPISFHGLRHTFATIGVQSRMDIKSLSSILGHSNAAMTLNIYASDDEQAKQVNIQNLSKMLAEEQDSDF